MSRRLSAIACAACLTVAGGILWAADGPAPSPEPPVLLKKKDKPRPAEPPTVKPAEKKPTSPPKNAGKPDDPPAEQPAAEAAELTARIAKEMRTADERLARQDVGERTRHAQQAALKGIDQLIELARRPPPESDANESRDQQQDKDKQKDPSQRRQATQAARQHQAVPRPRPGQTRPGAGGNRASDRDRRMSELYKDVWGHLPETLRQEMDQYGREQFMAKYNDLLKQYYTTIAEKGRRKGER